MSDNICMYTWVVHTDVTMNVSGVSRLRPFYIFIREKTKHDCASLNIDDNPLIIVFQFYKPKLVN